MNKKLDSKPSFLDFLIEVEKYQSPYAKSVGDPEEIVLAIIREYCMKAGLMSATANVFPQILSEIAIVPEIYLLLKLQSRMIKDIACLYGKEKLLNKDLLMYCLFDREKTGLLEKVVKMTLTRVIIRVATKPYLYSLTKKWDLGLYQKLKSLKITKWMPIIGTITGSTIAFLDTRAVGLTASRIFSREIQFET